MENTKVKAIKRKMEYLANLKNRGIPGPKNENSDELGLHSVPTSTSPTFLPQHSHVSCYAVVSVIPLQILVARRCF